MKASVSISDLRDALSVASLTLSKRLGSSDNALLYLSARKTATGTGGLYLFSFDGIARTMVKISAAVETEGRTVINPTNLIGSLSKVIKDGQLTLTQGEKKDSLSVTGAGRKMKFPASGELENFEALLKAMPLSSQENFIISATTFKQLIRQSAPFVDRPDKEDAANFNRGDTNLLIKAKPEGYEACATEGNALAIIQVKDASVSSNATDLKIPIRSVLNLKNMLEKMKGQDIRVIIGTDASGENCQLYLRTDNIFYGTVLDSSKFRDYERVMKLKASHHIRMPKEHFQGLVQNAAPFVGKLKNDDNVLVFYFGKTKTKITAGKSAETFEEEAESEAVVWPENKPEAVRMAFSPAYMQNVARVINGEHVVVSIAENQVIAFFSSDKDDVTSTYAVAKYADTAPVAKAA